MTTYTRNRVMWSSLEGNGHRTASEHYPFQGLALVTREYGDEHPLIRLLRVTQCRSLDAKYMDYPRTPFGTPVTQVVRLDGLGIIASKCGYCNEHYNKGGKCRCHLGPTPNVDDFIRPRDIDDDARSPEGLRAF